MSKFLKDLFSEKTAASSKRAIAIFIVLNLVAMTWIAVIRSLSGTPPQFMFDALSLVAAGGLGLTAMERIFAERKANDVLPPAEPTPPAPEPQYNQCQCNCRQCQTYQGEQLDV